MSCFRCVLRVRGGWLDHNRTKPLADTSPVASDPSQHLCPRPALPSLHGKDGKVILVDTAQEPGAAARPTPPPLPRDVLAWSCSLSYVLLFPFPRCAYVLDLLVDFSSSLASDIIGISNFFPSCFFFHVLLVTSALCLDSHHFLFQLLPLFSATGRAPHGSFLSALGS